jgi:hypothetical protein
MAGHRIASLLKASPKGEGFHPSQTVTLRGGKSNVRKNTEAEMENLGRASGLWIALATILICPISLRAESPQAQPTIIISVTAPPSLSTLIHGSSVVSTAWSQSKPYTGVSIAVLVNSALVGQTPMADAYLTTRIGPGTTVMDEIAHTRFTVPAELAVCSEHSCGAMVTLFSGLSLGPGNYFVTMSPNAMSNGLVGWFPSINPTVLVDTGVSKEASFIAFAVASYPPASVFQPYTLGISPPFPPMIVDAAMNITVTATAGTAAFAGTPGRADCHGETVSALARQFGGLHAAASALGFPSVRALQDAINAFCGG